jgi:glutaredoxin
MQLIMMHYQLYETNNMLTLYSKKNCTFCDRAKTLLESRKIVYNVINVDEDLDAREFLIDQGLRSVPQVFNGTTLIQGGYQGLAGQPEEFWNKFEIKK